MRQDLASLTSSLPAAEQQLQSKAEELKQHQDLVAQRDLDLTQLRQEREQSAAACKQLQANADDSAEREAALRAQADRQQDELEAAREQLAGKIHCMFLCCPANKLLGD